MPSSVGSNKHEGGFSCKSLNGVLTDSLNVKGALMSFVLFKGVMFIGGNSVKLEKCTEGIYRWVQSLMYRVPYLMGSVNYGSHSSTVSSVLITNINWWVQP